MGDRSQSVQIALLERYHWRINIFANIKVFAARICLAWELENKIKEYIWFGKITKDHPYLGASQILVVVQGVVKRERIADT